MESTQAKHLISRRSLLGSTVAGAAALSIAGTARAAEKASSAQTDAAYDVVVVGIGFAGMVSAMSAADAGASVLLVEKLADGHAGGNSRVCGQMFLYGNEDEKATKSYLTALFGSRDVPAEIVDLYAKGYASSKSLVEHYANTDGSRYLDVATMEGAGAILGKMSPEYPEFDGAVTTQLWSTHPDGVSDSYLYQSVRENLETNYADKVEVWFESPAKSLISDADGAVTGVVVTHDGKDVRVGAKGVVLACGGFENDRDLVAAYMNLVDYACIGALGNTGDGIRMAQGVNAKMWHMTSYAGGFGLGGLSFMVPEDANAIGIETLTQGEMNTGAVILVGKEGRRWVNESETPRHGKVFTGNGQWLNPEFPDGIYAIYDKTQYDAIVAAKKIPEEYAGTVIACATVAEAARTIGCEESVLQETIDDFNGFATNGKDYQFGRDASYMRAFDGEGYYLIPLKPELLNTQGGPERDADCRVLDANGDAIKGLYSAGELGGVTPLMYAGGMNVGECFITGDIAGRNAAGK